MIDSKAKNNKIECGAISFYKNCNQIKLYKLKMNIFSATLINVFYIFSFIVVFKR